MSRRSLHALRIGKVEYLLVGVPLDDAPSVSELTPVEREIVELAARGMNNAQLAEARGTSRATVVNQLGSIYRKLGLSGRAQLLARFPR